MAQNTPDTGHLKRHAPSTTHTPTLDEWIISTEAARELRGKGGPPLVNIPRLTAYHDVDHVLRSKDFVQAGGGHRENAPMTLHTVVSLSDQDHFERRRLEAPVFSRQSLSDCEQEVLGPTIATVLANYRVPATGAAEVRTDLLLLARDILTRVSARIVGIDVGDDPDDVMRLATYADRLSDGHNVDWSSRDHAEVMRVALDAKQRFVAEYFVPSWERRRTALAAATTVPVDLLVSMIGGTDHFQKWDLDAVVRETILFLTAAIGSPARALPYVVSELENWLADHAEDRAKLADADFIRNAINETLRLHTPGSPKLRRASCDVTLPSGRHVREGEDVAADIAAANHDAQVFGADATAFNPRRAVSGVQPFGVAFGAGPHTCIGLFMTIGKAAADGAEPTGVLVRLLLELYRVGMHLDPDRPPTRQPDNPKRFATLPILMPAIEPA